MPFYFEKKKIPFWKIEGAGNDFVIMEVKALPKKASLKNFVQELCNRHKGVGADGVVFMKKQRGMWAWDFYNSDASSASMCGNAARCVSYWLLNIKKEKAQWLSQRGRVVGKEIKKTSLQSSEMAVSWPVQIDKVQMAPHSLQKELQKLKGLSALYHVEAGVPHLVLISSSHWPLELRSQWSPHLRSHPSLGKEGANVTWLSLKNQECVTFERGVEGETLACGSGAVAAFLASQAWSKLSLKKTKTYFDFPGARLKVNLDKKKDLWLEGPVRLVFTS